MSLDYFDVLKAEIAVLASGSALFLVVSTIDMGYAEFQGAERALVHSWVALFSPAAAAGITYPFRNIMHLSDRSKSFKTFLVQTAGELCFLSLLIFATVFFTLNGFGGTATATAAAVFGVSMAVFAYSWSRIWEDLGTNLFVKMIGVFSIVFVAIGVSTSANRDLIVDIEPSSKNINTQTTECLRIIDAQCKYSDKKQVRMPEGCQGRLHKTDRLDKTRKASGYVICSHEDK